MKISKTQITKLGVKIRRKLRTNEVLLEDDIIKLQEYRTSFKDDLAPVFDIISKIGKQDRKDTIISFRIKRIESILSKIKREPTMALGNMGDIAGCRLIVYTDNALKKIIKSIEKNFIVKNVNDYISTPKEDGYNGYHFYVESPVNKNKLVEIQVRTIQTHSWASLVEIIDMLFDLKLKEGEENVQLKLLLKLLSLNKSEISLSEKAEIIKIDSVNNIYNKLLSVFLSNHLSIRKDWLALREFKDNNFFIIEVDKDNKSTILSFKRYEDAEDVYFKMFLNNSESNFVLTHIEKPNFKRICTAYASYILTRHNYLDDWNYYVRDVLSEDLKNGNHKKITELGEFIKRNLDDRLAVLNSEIMFISTEINGLSEDKSVPIGIEEWNEEIQDRIRNVEELKKEMNWFLKKYKPNFWTRLLN